VISLIRLRAEDDQRDPASYEVRLASAYSRPGRHLWAKYDLGHRPGRAGVGRGLDSPHAARPVVVANLAQGALRAGKWRLNRGFGICRICVIF
jgi:hypothetical protein